MAKKLSGGPNGISSRILVASKPTAKDIAMAKNQIQKLALKSNAATSKSQMRMRPTVSAEVRQFIYNFLD